MSIGVHYCPFISKYYFIIMKVLMSSRASFNQRYSNYTSPLSIFVFHYPLMPKYNQHYGAKND